MRRRRRREGKKKRKIRKGRVRPRKCGAGRLDHQSLLLTVDHRAQVPRTITCHSPGEGVATVSSTVK